MRKVAFGLISLVVLVGIGWTAVWFYAAHEAGRQLDAWLATEAAQGRTWTCPDRAVGGYPLAVDVSCLAPTFAGRAMGQVVQVGVAGLAAGTALTHPKSLTVTLRAPLTYKTSDGKTDLKATWSTLAIDLGALPDPNAFALVGTDLAVDGTFGEAGRQTGSAAALDAYAVLDRRAADPTLEFTIGVKGAPVAALDDLLGGRVPADIALTGKLDKADAGDARTPEEAIEHWRQAGGRLALAASKLSRGASSVSGSGTLALDEAHRPQGRIDASFIGLEPVLKRYGISGNLAAAGSLLSSLFGGGKPQPEAQPGGLNLPISLQDGRLGIGPIRTQIAMPPLY